MHDMEKRCSTTNTATGGLCEHLLENMSVGTVFQVGYMSHFNLHADRGSVDGSDLSGGEGHADYGGCPIGNTACSL